MPYTSQAGTVTTVSRSFTAYDSAFIWVNHRVSTAYVEAIPTSKNGNNRTIAAKYDRRASRQFTLTFPTLRYRASADVGLGIPPEQDLYLLEQFYRSHYGSKPFKYIHPIYGKLTVTFGNALVIPTGVTNGGGTVEGLTIMLIEVIKDDHPFSNLINYTSTDINFPKHKVSTEYQDETLRIRLGGNYLFAVNPHGHPERTFTLTFAALLYYYDHDDNINPLVVPSMNMGTLELLYHQHRLTGEFIYEHPAHGNILVRFKEPLTIPATVGPHGVVPEVNVKLLEVLR